VQSVTEQNNYVRVGHPRPNVALVTLNRPERMNSMAFDVMVPLKKVLEELTYDNSTRVISPLERMRSRIALRVSADERPRRLCRTDTEFMSSPTFVESLSV